MNGKYSRLLGVTTAAVAGLAVFAVTRSMHAQSGGASLTGRIACVDVVQVFNEYQKQKDLTEEIAEIQKKLSDENAERRKKLDEMQATIEKLNRDDPTFVTRTREVLAAQIDYKNWVELKQADVGREVGVWSVQVYKDVLKAVEEVAQRDGYDLVLYRGQFEPQSMEPDAIRDQIRNHHLLYANPAADLTQVVTEKLNKDYRAQPRVKMMFVP